MELKWARSVTDYVSSCGRFRIINHSLTSKPKWILHDTARPDALLPQYGWTCHCLTLRSAKKTAQRIVDNEARQYLVSKGSLSDKAV